VHGGRPDAVQGAAVAVAGRIPPCATRLLVQLWLLAAGLGRPAQRGGAIGARRRHGRAAEGGGAQVGEARL
jgi:hypothetical protein